MANPRKVQAEIDKLLKKVAEGIEIYEGVEEKFTAAPDRATKEKIEADLKKEIKKLQRLREQVKALIQAPEVKNKTDLEKHRRAVEVKMESFKITERETKTKAFSKEGLASGQKLDPAEKAKVHTCGWLRNALSELNIQNEQLEYDLENEPSPSSGSRKKSGKGSADARETRLSRARFHILKMEQLLRLVEAGDLAPEDVDLIEDEAAAFVEAHEDLNFLEADPDLYDQFELPEVGAEDEDPVVAAAAEKQKREEDERVKRRADERRKAEEEAAAKKKAAGGVVVDHSKPTGAAVAAVGGSKKAGGTDDDKGSKSGTKAVAVGGKVEMRTSGSKTPTTPVSGIAMASPSRPVAPGSGGRTMAAVLREVGTPTTPLGASGGSGASPLDGSGGPGAGLGSGSGDAAGLLDDDGDAMNDDTFGDDVLAGVDVAMPGSLGDMAAMTAARAEWEAGKKSFADAAAAAALKPPAAAASGSPVPSGMSGSPVPSGTSGSPGTGAAAAASSSPLVPPPQLPQPAAAAPQAATPPAAPAASAAAPPSLQADRMHAMLDMSLRNLPHVSDCERLKPFVPPNPIDKVPPHYPKTVHPAISDPATFRNCQPDTLFFVFYYQQGTYQAYLAARELKRLTWRYHKKFSTWFQRHERPLATTAEQEQGTYVYFDYDSCWTQRLKSEFVFKYSYLEDELPTPKQ